MILKIDPKSFGLEIAEGKVARIGRHGHGADLQIDDANVSRNHAEFKLQGEQWMIMDTESLNGTYRNNERLLSGQWYPVLPTDHITILHYNLQFYPSEPTKTVLKPEPSAASKPAQKNNADINTRFRDLLNLKLPITIGRLDTNDIVLPDVVNNDRIVSRNHAEIFFEGGKYWIKDMGSTNGTYVNDEKLEPLQPKALEHKDIVLIHLHLFSLTEGYRDLREEVAIRAEGIGKTYANGFVGLNPMTVEIPYKQIVALMGPSGCGKSTLLKALNGDNPPTSGNVYIHGLSLRENYQLLKRKIGYVPQDDTIHKELTVQKTLYMAAKLRLPDDTTDAEINLRITEVLASLNFDDGVRVKKIAGLSGGQRKRICIAVELLSRPTILFLDEPTSPLDPETIESFLISLQKLAQNGTTIVMVTHKPEDLNYADKVIFMAIKGYFVYYGDKKGLLDKFRVDHIIKVYTKCGNEQFEANEYYLKPGGRIIQREPVKDIGIDKQNSLMLQFYWLTKRYLHIKLSDKDNLILLLAQPVIIALLVSFIFRKINISVMMLTAVSAIWFGVSNSSKEIVGEFAVYKRERMFNLNIHTYIISKWTVLSLIALVQVIIFIGIIHISFTFLHNDKTLGGYLQNTAFMFYIASSATLFGLFLSAFYNTTEKVLTVVPIALMPQIMLAGVVEPIKNIGVDITSYFTFGRWGTEGLIRLQKKEFTKFALDQLYYNQALSKKGKTIVELFNSIQANLLIMFLISLLMYILIYVSLKKKDTI